MKNVLEFTKESIKPMTESELLDLHIAVAKERHVRASFPFQDHGNNWWKLPMNLDTLKDMGRMDLYKREMDRQAAIKAADKECFKRHGRYMTRVEFELGTFKK